jgi:hypothetical protein
MTGNFGNANLKQLSAHQVGNKTDGSLIISKTSLEIGDDDLRLYLLKNLTGPFANTEAFAFTSANGDPMVNPMFQYISSAFASLRSFHTSSISIAKHLFDVSVHPNIKTGDLVVALFEDVQVEGASTQAIGIFKCENKSNFVNIEYEKNQGSSITHQLGLSLEKLDKGCLIYDLERNGGYRISIVDRSSKSQDAFYWTELFLKVGPVATNFSFTRDVLDATKAFVTEKMADEFEMSRADQIDMLNRSAKYFKENDEYNSKAFESEILESPELIKSFRKFKKEYQDEHNASFEDNFEIEQGAVKKYSKVLKSVLKLDKNFHVYIHGDRDLIERGQEKDGRKYYKIYFKDEA